MPHITKGKNTLRFAAQLRFQVAISPMVKQCSSLRVLFLNNLLLFTCFCYLKCSLFPSAGGGCHLRYLLKQLGKEKICSRIHFQVYLLAYFIIFFVVTVVIAAFPSQMRISFQVCVTKQHQVRISCINWKKKPLIVKCQIALSYCFRQG